MASTADFDLAFGFTWVEIADGAGWLGKALAETARGSVSNFFDYGFPADWVPDDIEAERRRILELEGDERIAAAGALADKVARDLAAIPFVNDAYPQLIAERIGCADQPGPGPSSTCCAVSMAAARDERHA